MDSTADVEMSEKRLVENGDSEARPTKMPRIGNGSGGGLRVAEIVLVLSAMAKIRSGKKPTEAEVELMAKAREKLVELCEGLAPKDIVGQDWIGTVIEDLGLNAKARDHKFGFRGHRLTIVERFSQAKRKMEESRIFAAQSSPYTQPVQTSFNAAAENRGTSHTVRMIPSDRPSHPPNSSGVTSASLGHVSAAAPSIQYQLPTSDVRASKHLIFYNLERQICYELRGASYAKANSHDLCSSSCGSIRNITSPFRLATDPLRCRDLRYDLSCENNVTVTYLPVDSVHVNSYGPEYQRYYVQAINYNNNTIQLVDPDIQKDDFCSIPSNSL